MTSKIVVNNIEADSGINTITFINEVTAPTFNGNITGTAATFTTGTFSGNVDIAGALTYEDVTNVDSVGVITARSGIHVTGGSIGIRTDNPLFELDLRQTGQADLLIGSYNAGGARLMLDGDSNGDGSGADFCEIVADTSGDLTINARNPASDAELIFKTGSGTERLRITSDGSVGIGTNVPQATLHLLSSGGAATGNEGIRLQTTQATGGNWISFNDTARKGYFGYKETSDDGIYLVNEKNSHIVLGTNGAERLRIKPDGVVQIGDAGHGSSNGDRKLEVIGSGSGQAGLLIANNAVSASGTCDISFAPSNKITGSQIICEAQEDFSSGANRTADLVFKTRKDGTLSEKLRIHADGVIQTFNHAECLAYKNNQSVTGGDGSTHELGTDTFNFNRGGFTHSSGNIVVPKTGTYRCIIRLEGVITSSAYSIRAIRCVPRINTVTNAGVYTDHWHSFIAGPSSNTHWSFNDMYYLNLTENDQIDAEMTWYPYASRTGSFDLSISLFYIG